MAYVYTTERPWLFTEEGQVALIKTRDNAFRLLDSAGAFNGMKAFKDVSVGDTFRMMALLDRLVEMDDIREVAGPNVRGQDRIFVRKAR
jgi:hypothetical protein